MSETVVMCDEMSGRRCIAPYECAKKGCPYAKVSDTPVADTPDVATLHWATRKQHPVYSGALRYFPKALMAVAHCSFVGNEQHNAGQPLHWDRTKSTDEPDALVRHLLQAGEIDTDGVRHTAKVAWRALAMLEKELEGAE